MTLEILNTLHDQAMETLSIIDRDALLVAWQGEDVLQESDCERKKHFDFFTMVRFLADNNLNLEFNQK